MEEEEPLSPPAPQVLATPTGVLNRELSVSGSVELNQERRKMLQRMRQQSRASLSESVDTTASTKAPKSPHLKALREKMKQAIQEDIAGADEEQPKEKEAEKKKAVPEEELFEFKEMLKFEMAEEIIFNDKNLVTPASQIDFQLLLRRPKQFWNTVTGTCCLGCDLPRFEELPQVPGPKQSERNLVEAKDKSHVQSWMTQQRVTDKQLLDFERQRLQCGMSESDPLLVGEYPANGVYSMQPSTMTHLQLHSESIPPTIAPMTVDNMALSRMTQRLLRELKNGFESARIRRQWYDMTRKAAAPPQTEEEPALPRGGAHINTDLPTIQEAPTMDEGDHSRKVPEKTDSKLQEKKSPPAPAYPRDIVPSEIYLLDNIQHGPILHVAENPMDHSYMQPVVVYDATGEDMPDDLSNMSMNAANPMLHLENLPSATGTRKSSQASQRSVLKLHIHQLVLNEHPLLSSEDRKVVELKHIYKQYRELFENKTLQHVMQRATLLIRNLYAVLERIMVSGVDTKANPTFDEQEKYDADLEELHSLYDDAIETLPMLSEINFAVDNLTGTIYRCWCDLKEIRRLRGHVGTTMQLSARRLHSNLLDTAHSARLARVPMIEDADAPSPLSPEGAAQHDYTDVDQQVWETLKNQLSKVPYYLEQAHEVFERNEAMKQAATTAKPPAGTPKAGTKPQALEQQAEARQAKYKRALDSMKACVDELISNHGLLPLYALRLSEDGTVTADNLLPAAEARRRAALSSTRYRLAVKVNGKAITVTDYYPLRWPSLAIDVKKYFEFRLLHQLQDLSIDVYARKLSSLEISDVLVANVPIPYPGQPGNVGGTSSTGTMVAGVAGGGAAAGLNDRRTQHAAHAFAPILGWYTFASQLTGGRLLGDALLFPQQNFTDLAMNTRIEGNVLCTTEYEVATVDRGHVHDGYKIADTAVIPRGNSKYAGSAYRMDGKVTDFSRENDFQQMLPDLSELDVNDPDNDHLLYLKSKRTASTDSEVFRLTGSDFATVYGEDGASYSNFTKFKESDRMKLLKLRTIKPFLFTAPIPIDENRIRGNEEYKKILHKELETLRSADGQLPEDEAAVSKRTAGTESVNLAKVTGFLQRVRNSQTALSRSRRKKRLVTSSVVNEHQYFHVRWIDFSVLFERKHSLRPKMKERPATTVQVTHCELLVQVVGAKNIPMRSDFDDTATIRKKLSAAGGGAAGEQPVIAASMLDEKKLKEKARACTFMEVHFQDQVVATASYEGGTPMWKQSLSLPFKPTDGDFSPAALDQMRDEVYFALFDEYIEDDAERGGYLEGERTIRVDKRYLGGFSVPLYTIYHEGRVEGIFRMDTPAINFGYDHAETSASRRDTTNASMFVNQEEDTNLGGAMRRPPQQRSAVTWQNFSNYPIWTSFMFLYETLTYAMAPSQTALVQWQNTQADSLLHGASYVHQDTQNELSYFACDEKATFLKILVTLDPTLVSSPPVGEEVALSNVIRDDRAFVAYSRSWLDSLHSIGLYTEKRSYKIFATNSNGLNVLICRYLTGLKPPAGFESRRACMHLVSIIPFMKDAQSFIGALDLWCTTRQFWEIGAGDEEEHACTLYNYLYYLAHREESGANEKKVKAYPSDDRIGKESVFLVMGKAIPEGETVYVMVRDVRRKITPGPEGLLLINPCTGYTYSALDPNCPLREIYCIATPYNIWANIQYSARPVEMVYDVLNTAAWRPFFGVRMPYPAAGLQSIQDEVAYEQTAEAYAMEIEKAMFQAIRNAVRKWRSKRARSTTTFHPDACNAMRDLLPRLEKWKISGSQASADRPRAASVNRALASNNRDGDEESGAGAGISNYEGNNAGLGDVAAERGGVGLGEISEEIRSRMKTILRTRTLRGCPLNMPFTDVDEILAKVKTLCIHEAAHPEVQFVLAVRAFPVYNSIVSLWIFMGTLETAAVGKR